MPDPKPCYLCGIPTKRERFCEPCERVNTHLQALTEALLESGDAYRLERYLAVRLELIQHFKELFHGRNCKGEHAAAS